MPEKISFQVSNEFDYNLYLVVEPFGPIWDIKPNEVVKVVFTSTKHHDISNDIVVISKDQMMKIWILGGWIKFELFQDGVLLMDLEC